MAATNLAASALLVITWAPSSIAQFGGAGFGNYGPPSSSAGDGHGKDGYLSGDGSSNTGNQFGSNSRGSPFGNADPTTIVIAHAIPAAVAFGAIFPIGGIMIRLLSFNGAWLAHAIVQGIGLVLSMVALGFGIYMATRLHLFDEAHVIIGVVLLSLVILQPFTGIIHHHIFKKIKRRSGWSYIHLWFGRMVIILGIANGGLGFDLGRRLPFARSSGTWTIVYSIVAGALGAFYILSACIGESRRRRQIRTRRRKSTSRSSSASVQGRPRHNSRDHIGGRSKHPGEKRTVRYT